MYSYRKIIDSHMQLSSISYGPGYFQDIMNPATNPLSDIVAYRVHLTLEDMQMQL